VLITLCLAKKKVNDLVTSGAIYDARRPRNIYINGWMVLHLNELVPDNSSNKKAFISDRVQVK